jgi:hypothetical protein
MKIFGRLKSNLLFSHLPHTSIKTKTLIIVPTPLYKRDTGRILKGAEDRGEKTTEHDRHKVGQNCKIRNLIICNFHHHADKIKDENTGGVSGTESER